MSNKYLECRVLSLTTSVIDELYEKLIVNRKSFVFIRNNNKKYILTKEMSLFEISNFSRFYQEFLADVYYKTVIEFGDYCEDDLKLFYDYINRYREKIISKKTGEFLFGCIAVRTKNNNFITTVRGKKDLDSFTVVTDVDFDKHLIKVYPEKASLNANLLAEIFKNEKVKIIVHLHEVDFRFPFYKYAFPGTVRDGNRNNSFSFNIEYHGVFLLFDEEGKLIEKR